MNAGKNLTAKNDNQLFLAIFLFTLIPIAGGVYAIVKNPQYELAGFKENCKDRHRCSGKCPT
jgi:hypothetical protein